MLSALFLYGLVLRYEKIIPLFINSPTPNVYLLVSCPYVINILTALHNTKTARNTVLFSIQYNTFILKYQFNIKSMSAIDQIINECRPT